MSYYMEDSRGDIWGNIGRTFKRAVRDVGKVVKVAAPILAPIVPVFGAATAIGKAASLHGKVTKMRDAAQATINSAYGVTTMPPLPQPVFRMSGPLPPPSMPGQSMFQVPAATRRPGTPRRRRRPTMRRTTRRPARRTTRRRSYSRRR